MLDPYDGLSVREVNPEKERTLNRITNSAPVDLEQLRRSTSQLSQVSSRFTAAASMMPQMIADAVNTPGASIDSLATQFAPVEQSLNLEQWRMLTEEYLANASPEEQLNIWERLPLSVRQALEVDGFVAPTGPPQGGIDIPFTSMIRRGLNKIPGVDIGGNGNFEIAGGSDNILTDVVNTAGKVVESPIEWGIKPAVGAVIEAGDWASETFVSRPIVMGNMRADELGMNVADGTSGGVIDNASRLRGMSSIAQGIAFSVESLFSGRAGELWDLTAEGESKIRPSAISRASEILEGDAGLHALAVAYVVEGGDREKTAERVSGLKIGEQGYTDVFLALVDAEVKATEGPSPFMEAVEHMTVNRIGLGAIMAENAGAAQGTAGHAWASAGFELGTLMILDPTIVLGKANRIRKIAQLGIQAGDVSGELNRAYDLAQIARRIDDLDDPLQAGDDLVRAGVLAANAPTASAIRNSQWARVVVTPASQVEYGRSVNRVMEKIADVARGTREVDGVTVPYSWMDLRREVPATKYLTQDLAHAMSEGVITDNVDSVWDYFRGVQGQRSLISGAIGRDPRVIALPRMSRGRERWAAQKNWWNKTLDLSGPLPQGMRNQIEELSRQLRSDDITIGEFNEAHRVLNGERAAMTSAAQRWVVHPMQATVNRIVKHVPRNPYIYTGTGRPNITDDLVPPGDPTVLSTSMAREGINEFERYLEFGDLANMDQATKASYLDAYIRGNQGQRAAIVRTYTTEMLGRTGLLDGSEAMQDILTKHGLALKQHFGAGDELESATDLTASAFVQHSAIWDKQMSDNIAIPNFRDLQRAVRKENFLTAFAGPSFNRVDGMISRYWKPMVILKLGFIARAAGEETTSFVLRLGGTNYLRAQYGRRWVSGMVMDPATKMLVPVRDVAPSLRIARSVGEQLRRWSQTTDTMQIQVGLAKASETKSAQARILMMLGDQTTGEGVLKVQDELRALLAPEIAEHIANMPARSRWMANMGQATITATHWASTHWYDALRAAKLPSKQAIARSVLGSNWEGSRRGIAQWTRRPELFSLDPVNAPPVGLYGSIRETVEVDNLMLATHIAQTNPSVATAISNGLGSAWAEYLPPSARGPKLPENQFLSSAPTLMEVTSWTGRKHHIPMAGASERWVAVDQLGVQARQAIGQAMLFPALDPAVIGSGALLAANSHLGDDVLDELMSMFGPDWEKTVLALRSQLSEFDDADYLGDLRRAMALGEPLPDHALIDRFVMEKFREASPRAQSLIYPDRRLLAEPLRRSREEAMMEASNRMRAFMNQPAYQPSLSAMTRMAFDRGVQIARPLPSPNQMRVYGIQMTGDIPELLQSLSAVPEEVAIQLERNLGAALSVNGFTPEQIDGLLPELMSLFDPTNTWASDLSNLTGGDPVGLLATPVTFASPDVATAALEAMSDTLVTMGVSPAKRPFGLASMDAPNRELFNPSIFRQASTPTVTDVPNWGNTDYFIAASPEPVLGMAPLDPGQYTTFVELDNGQWFDEALLDQVPDGFTGTPTGRTMLVNGESEHRLRMELGNLRLSEMERLMFSPRGDALNEAMAQMIGGTFDPGYHMHQIPFEDLPKQTYAPVMIQHESLRWDRIVQGGFNGVIDPAMQAIIRTPHFMHNFAASIPLADNYYRTAVRLDPNDVPVRQMLDDQGFSDDSMAELLDHIHAGWGNPDLIAEDSDWGRLMAALSNPRTKPEDGALALLRAMDGTNDRLDRAIDEVYEGLTEAHYTRTGKIPDAADDGDYRDLATMLVRGEVTPDDFSDRLDDIAEQIADARAAGQPTEALEARHAILEAQSKLPPAPKRAYVLPEDERIAALAEQWGQIQAWGRNRNVRYEEAVEAASVRAADMTVEFIDDHRLRSQFQQTVRNLMPFYFAEEQFIKRQIRMIVDSPEAIRRASLLMNAGRQSGLIDTDLEGNEVFVFPGTQLINENLVRFAGMLTGMDGLEVYAQPMSANVEYMLPGYSGNYIEGGTGPFVGFTTAFLASRFPELEWIDRNPILQPSEISQGRHPLEHFVPPVILKLTDTLGMDLFSHDRLMSAQLRATQMAIANGDAPAEDAPASEQEAFLDRTREHARIINFMDFILYGVSPLPSGSKIQLDAVEINEDFTEIVYGSGLPYQEGMALFFKLHPEATAFTVFQSRSTTGARIEQSPELYSMLDEYDDLVTDYPLAAAYLLPQPDGESEDEWAKRSSREMYRRGLRERLAPEEFLEEIYYRDAANDFYDRRTQYQRDIWLAEQKNDDAAARQLDIDMKVWEEGFAEQHPTWELRSRQHSQALRRQEAKDQRDAVLAMSREELPPGDDVDAVLGLMLSHQTFSREMEALRDDPTARGDRARKDLRASFFQYAAQYIYDYPAAEAYFGSNIRSDEDVQGGYPDLLFETEAALGREL